MFVFIIQKFFLHGGIENGILINCGNSNEESLTAFGGGSEG